MARSTARSAAADSAASSISKCRDLAAQHRIFQAALRVGADGVGRDLAERPADAALAHARDHRALVLQQIFRDIPAAIDRADHMRFRHAHIVEEGFAERRIAGDQQDRFRGHALRGHVEQNETDAVMLLRRAVGAHQAEDPVGVIRIGRPDLLAVDDEVVAVAFGAGLQRGQIRSGVRLGIALAPADEPGRDLRQMLFLLRIGAVFQKRRPEHGNAERGQRLPRADRRHFLAHDLGLFAIEAAAAIFRRPMRHGPTLVAHPFEPDALRLGGEFGVTAAPEGVAVGGHRLAHLRRAIGLEPGAGFTAEIFQIGHGGVSIWDVGSTLAVASRNSICLCAAPCSRRCGHGRGSGVSQSRND